MRKLLGLWATFQVIVSGTRVEFNNSKTVVNSVTLDDQPIPDYSSYSPLSSKDSIFDSDKKADGFEDMIHVDLSELKKSAPEANYTWKGCESPDSNDWCIIIWGPDHGYPPVPDQSVEAKCFQAQGCCPDSSSLTLFNDCVWDGCDGEKDSLHNSSAYCGQQVIMKNYSTSADCFEAKGCCDDQAQNQTQKSPTGYVPCSSTPGYSLPPYGIFCVSESTILVVSLAVEGICRYKGYNAHQLIRWIFLTAAATQTAGSGIGWWLKDDAQVTPVATLAILGASAVTGYLMYRKLSPPPGPGALPLLPPGGAGINQQINYNTYCTIS